MKAKYPLEKIELWINWPTKKLIFHSGKNFHMSSPVVWLLRWFIYSVIHLYQLPYINIFMYWLISYDKIFPSKSLLNISLILISIFTSPESHQVNGYTRQCSLDSDFLCCTCITLLYSLLSNSILSPSSSRASPLIFQTSFYLDSRPPPLILHFKFIIVKYSHCLLFSICK